ncbi:GNAT family N-acetyltransferase [Paludibaculum fermentans]|uniref:GNAT family N-acetyltransferase n=1 Tax=Paludibaculum fermentans TaxID=1473598 RepID=UPI003EBCFEC1
MSAAALPNQPETRIELGQDLVLQALDASQAETIYAAVDANREHLRVWLPWVDFSRSPADTLRFLQEMEAKRAAALTVAYSLWTGPTELVGIIGVHDISLANGNLQIGYWVAKAQEGKGLISRACEAMLRLAFETLGMERVEIRCAEGNQRSARVPERLGFQFEGILRHSAKLHGEFVDMRLYSLLAEEYRQRRGSA